MQTEKLKKKTHIYKVLEIYEIYVINNSNSHLLTSATAQWDQC